MKLVWKTFSICKDGNREDENEDAVYPLYINGTSLNPDHFSCAMADGATTSSFSKLWADLLVKESCASNNSQQDLLHTLSSARLIWKNELSQKKLPWPAEIKIRQGTYATLLWFHIWHKKSLFISSKDSAYRSWEANAVGDTCLFHVSKGRFIERFPLTTSVQFSNTPDLISTNLSYQNSRITNCSISGTWQKGDHFLIATDALAAWMMGGLERNTLGWQNISENLTSQVRYQSWIKALRRQSIIKNDDTSLISLSVDE